MRNPESFKVTSSPIIYPGVNPISRAFAATLTTYMTIEKINDDEYVIKTITGPVKKTRHMKFGVEFEDEAPTGGNMSVSNYQSRLPM